MTVDEVVARIMNRVEPLNVEGEPYLRCRVYEERDEFCTWAIKPEDEGDGELGKWLFTLCPDASDRERRGALELLAETGLRKPPVPRTTLWA